MIRILGDSLRNTIWVWDHDAATGEISNHPVHVSGGPDGSCIDAEGCLWTALIVTSARFGLDDPTGEDGAIFAVETGITGHPENRFRP